MRIAEPITESQSPLRAKHWKLELFTYFGGIIRKQGGTDVDVKARIGKARTTFSQLKNVWYSKVISQ